MCCVPICYWHSLHMCTSHNTSIAAVSLLRTTRYCTIAAMVAGCHYGDADAMSTVVPWSSRVQPLIIQSFGSSMH